MTTSPRWLSESYGPGGGGAAEGILRNLDATEMDPVTLLVRESAQNSWDARCGDVPVDYRIGLRTLGPSEAPVWRDLLLENAPTVEHLRLRASLARPVIRVLTVTDTGTKGLGGPTRADVVADGDSNFVSFVRKTGSSQDLDSRGGTYGYGKVVFHLVSGPHTVLVHTRCRVGDGFETRLIGWAVHESYSTDTVDGPKTFTGRHYWGRVQDGYVEPLVGEEADEMARKLGLKPFPADGTGTTVAVVDPDFGERDDSEAMQWIVDAMVWNLWPKMLPEGGSSPMRFSVTRDGVEIPVPRPSEVPHLRPFLWAHGEMDRVIEHKTMGRPLGRIGVRKFIAPPGPPPRVAQEAGIGERLHHTCLMRPVDLVVRYLEGPPFYEEHGGYAAVFRADPTMDRIFAATEPASHDNWMVDRLSGDDRRLARHALKKISDAMKEASGPTAVVNNAGDGVSLAGMSKLMAGLMAGAPGQGGSAAFPTGPDPTAIGPANWQKASTEGQDSGGAVSGGQTPGTGHHGRRGARLRYLEEPFHDTIDGNAVLIQRFELLDAGEQAVRGRLAVALSDVLGRESEPPIGASVPTVLGWRSDTGDISRSEELHVPGGDGRIWALVVKPAPDTVTEIAVSSDRKDGPT
ncbi:hypothetical protein P3T37_002181 [Kitasatospora sp. MAA4]|uniref:hypothetical protein n=1 Tax=Kitasatospora sp. MAA4 TaxID=3035093 RepID=UPI0024745406|nr:hypothetical protein [Kitasatospora sp. MAA4]MDH6132795.1 hypothetical protein [Kitasatospora sp. MAA4]